MMKTILALVVIAVIVAAALFIWSYAAYHKEKEEDCLSCKGDCMNCTMKQSQDKKVDSEK